MTQKSRRTFIKEGLASLGAAAFLGNEAPTQQMGDGLTFHSRLSLPKYVDPLRLPKRLLPVGTRKGVKQYRMRAGEFHQHMHSQLPPTKLWGFEAQYPGPLIEAMRDEPIQVEWVNQLPAKHIFAIDPHIHGAMSPSPPVRMVPHLHGARTDSDSDGLPEKWFTPGQSRHYSYANGQAAATLWYHDHAVGITRLNVYAGLSGFYLLRDRDERDIILPSGAYEIPLLIQDRTLDAKGQLVYLPSHEDGKELPPGVWGPEFFGELAVVNGVICPYLEVEARPYRLRMLNGSNSRFFNVYLNSAKSPVDVPSLLKFQQIGTDGGFLPKPVALNKILLGPAERADLIVDFSGLEGRNLTLANDAPAPYPGWNMPPMLHAPLYELMQFRVKPAQNALRKSVAVTLPATFHKLNESAAVRSRDFVLSERFDDQGRSLGVRINDKGYDDPVTETVKLGTMEKWRFINTTDDAHPMHLHLVQFQILHRQGFNTVAFSQGRLELVGATRPPATNEAGWKDTAVVSPQEVLTILVPFEEFTGRYVYHCHMLEHEDNDMMRPYEVVAADAEIKPAT